MSLPLCPLLLLAVGLRLAGTLNPSDPNTCSFWESFTTTTKESHSRPFSLLPSEPCERPWEGPHTCPQPTVVYRTVYRQVVKTDHRQRLQCCHGFYESRGFCVQCAPGMWGPQCDKPCSCGNNSSCDPKSGECSCPSGLQPPNCLQPCTPGYYGPACQFRCQCHGARCDPQTGACFCPAERTGPSCDLSCSQGTSGFFCPSTHPCQNGGVFQAPQGSCSCPPGWMGTICSLPCPEGFHGPSCSQECRCHNGGLCDRFTGQCRCAPGYTGDRCREECPVGRFGQDCAETRDCAPDARCFPANGACLCEHGFTGDRCTERLCPDGFYGLSCQAPCTCDPEHSLSCHPMNGSAPACRAGRAFTATRAARRTRTGRGARNTVSACTAASARLPAASVSARRATRALTVLVFVLPTPTVSTVPHAAHVKMPSPAHPSTASASVRKKGQFGEGCASHCDCDHSDGCDPVHGRCQCQAGWMGTRCHLSCPEGLWGVNCSNTCTCKNGGTCLPENGNCVCAPGFRGPSCQRSCQPGRYGKRCVPCKCANHSFCHPSNGTCYCLAGWTGPDCSQPCPPGHWGENCAQTCQCHHGGTCHPQDGSCICPLGWTGHHCLEGCPLGTFGANCSQPCQCGPGEKCHPETGACVCPPGHSGAPCRIGIQEPFTVMPTTPVAYNSLGAVIGIAVLGSLVVALVALFIGYRHWQKGKEHHHLAVAYSSGRLDGSEYVMPDVPPSYSHYYSNPSYHTLSQCSPNPPPANKVPGPLFASLQAPERSGGAHGHDNHTTLPADWKHRREPPPGPLDRGSSRLDRSYSYSYNNGPGPFYNKGLICEEELGASVASLSSENPYATIRDLPSLPGGPRESSYMEMKGPPSGSPPRQPPQFWDSQRRRQPQPQRDSGTYEQPSPLIHDRDPVGSQPPLLPGLPPGHYDSPKNSHIPGHYDLPPVRHPPSPPLRRQDR
uniref:Platelet endothelial aggregation receptor 1 n=1 Tax=Macaca fascicularis TaxID=9541 RepID=A0A2K5UFL1_MACFA